MNERGVAIGRTIREVSLRAAPRAALRQHPPDGSVRAGWFGPTIRSFSDIGLFEITESELHALDLLRRSARGLLALGSELVSRSRRRYQN